MNNWEKNKIINSQITKKQLYSYYVVKNLSVPIISKIYKCSNRSIYRRLKLYKIKIRSISEAKKLSNIFGDKNPCWKGGKIRDGNGYVWSYCPGHPHCFKDRPYVYEHRLVIEKFIGRYLKSDEIVHHINGIKDDNRLINLCLTVLQKHNTRTVVEILQQRIRDLEQELKERNRDDQIR